MRRTLPIALVATAALAAAAGSAGAAVVDRVDWCAPGCSSWPEPYTFHAAPGELNDVHVRIEGEDVVFREEGAGVPLEAGEGCRIQGGEARCRIDDSDYVWIEADDLADRIAIDPSVDHEMLVQTLAGDGVDETFSGSSTLMHGGRGDDLFRAGGMPVCCVDDSVRYITDHDAAVTVRLGTDGPTAGNGAPGESDLIEDGLEDVMGTWEDGDVLVGDGDDNDLDTAGGAAALEGHGGEDTLWGGFGRNNADGGDGDDRIWPLWEPGEDGDVLVGDGDDNDLDTAGGAAALEGHGGEDTLWGGFGRNNADGGDGDDRIWPLWQPGEVRGGSGRDMVRFDNYAPEAPVFVWLDDLANDGSDYDGDLLPDALGNVHADVEDLRGSDAGDRLFGDDDANLIEGYPGDDWIAGLGGEDDLTAMDGDDVVVALDLEHDVVACGPGTDVVAADPADDVDADCEIVVGNVGDLPPLFEPAELRDAGKGAIWVRRQVNTGVPDWVSYVAPAGTASDVTATAGRTATGMTLRLADAAVEVVPGPGCASDGPDVVCEVDAWSAGLELGDGDDRVSVTGDLPLRVDCGAGEDDAELPEGAVAIDCEDGGGDVPVDPPAEVPVDPPLAWSPNGVKTASESAFADAGALTPIGGLAPLAPAAPAATPTAGGVRAHRRAILVAPRRVVAGLSCGLVAGTCRGTLRLVKAGRTLATGRYAVAAGQDGFALLRATRAGRARLARQRRATLVDRASARRWPVRIVSARA